MNNRIILLFALLSLVLGCKEDSVIGMTDVLSEDTESVDSTLHGWDDGGLAEEPENPFVGDDEEGSASGPGPEPFQCNTVQDDCPCDYHEDCDSGVCLFNGNTGKCGVLCDGQCATGFVCEFIYGNQPTPSPVCLPQYEKL